MDNYEETEEWDDERETGDRPWETTPVPTLSLSVPAPANALTSNIKKTKEMAPNFKCYSCKTKFFLPKDQKIIRCSSCGYRILLKVRTSNHITYKTE